MRRTSCLVVPKATNKIRIVRRGDEADVWAIGVDVRKLHLAPKRAAAAVR